MKTIQLTDRKGQTRKGLRVTVSTTFSCNIEDVWSHIGNVATLTYVCRPMARFSPCGEKLPREWETGKTYAFRFYFHSIIPIGIHTIRIESVDGQKHRIQSREYNHLVTIWDHQIRMETIHENTIGYTDEIEIYAGWLTRAVAWWSICYYRHRQRRWKKLLKNNGAFT